MWAWLLSRRVWLAGGVLAATTAALSRRQPPPRDAAADAAAASDIFVSDPARAAVDQPAVGALSPDGGRVAFGTRSGTVEIWELDGPQLIWRWRTGSGSVTAVAFAPDGHGLYTTGCDRLLRLWELTPSGPSQKAVAATPDKALSVATANDGRVATGAAGKVSVWRVRGGELTAVAEARVPGWPVHALAFSPAGDRLAFAAGDNWVRVWDADGGGPPERVRLSEQNQVRGLTFDPSGRGIVILDTEGRIVRWNLDDGEPWQLQLAVPSCRTATFSADLRRVAITHHNGAARVVRVPDPPGRP